MLARDLNVTVTPRNPSTRRSCVLVHVVCVVRTFFLLTVTRLTTARSRLRKDTRSRSAADGAPRSVDRPMYGGITDYSVQLYAPCAQQAQSAIHMQHGTVRYTSWVSSAASVVHPTSCDMSTPCTYGGSLKRSVGCSRTPVPTQCIVAMLCYVFGVHVMEPFQVWPCAAAHTSHKLQYAYRLSARRVISFRCGALHTMRDAIGAAHKTRGNAIHA